MRQATQRAIKRAREEHLPTLLEARTYRYMGHSMSDPGNYRTRAEIEKYQERDPLKLFIDSLKTNNVIGDDDLAQIEAQVKKDVEQSVRFAEESPLPDESELYTNIYANPL
jgi:pyruvate dehydrogenase E1 component alpha subunit